VTLEELNFLPLPDAKEALAKCCGSSQWVKRLEAQRPFTSREHLLQLADEIWFGASPEDWLEAFAHHPKIGVKSLENRFAATKDWSGEEQKSVQAASQQTLEKLLHLNEAYDNKFGYIFIVCATGKSAEEMMQILEQRLPNSPEEEIKIAMLEQNKITKLRLNKLLS